MKKIFTAVAVASSMGLTPGAALSQSAQATNAPLAPVYNFCDRGYQTPSDGNCNQRTRPIPEDPYSGYQLDTLMPDGRIISDYYSPEGTPLVRNPTTQLPHINGFIYDTPLNGPKL